MPKHTRRKPLKSLRNSRGSNGRRTRDPHLTARAHSAQWSFPSEPLIVPTRGRTTKTRVRDFGPVGRLIAALGQSLTTRSEGLEWPKSGELRDKFESTSGCELRFYNNGLSLAEGVGFEPTVHSRVQRFSRPPHSTTLAPLHSRPARRGIYINHCVRGSKPGDGSGGRHETAQQPVNGRIRGAPHIDSTFYRAIVPRRGCQSLNQHEIRN